MYNKIISLIVITLLFNGCALLTPKPRMLTGLKGWHKWDKVDYIIPPQASKLKNLKFCLSPGHGGEGMLLGYKAGPTGGREAEFNLKTALYLSEFLKKAGAKVVLTRDGDYYINLQDRCRIANNSGANYYIAMHHNAVSSPKANYCTVFYHGTPEDAIQSIDMARNVRRSINELMRTPGIPWLPVPSDYVIYPEWGFGEIRGVEVPAILGESTFHSNPDEEKRLKTHAYNRREAYGYFLGIVNYIYDGVPTATLTQPVPDEKIDNKQPLIKLTVLDGWGKANLLIPSSIKLSVDGKVVPHTFNDKLMLVSYMPEQPLKNNYHTINLIMTSLYKNSLKYSKMFQVVTPPEKIVVQCYPDTLPADNSCVGLIKVSAFDRDGEPVADGIKFSLSSPYGILESTEVVTRGGCAWTYLYPDTITVTTDLTASYDQLVSTCQVKFDTTISTITQPADMFYAIKQCYDEDISKNIAPLYVPRLSLPVDGIINQYQFYGEKAGTQPTRKNIIFKVKGMHPVYAAASGEVVAADLSDEANDNYPYPNYIVIKHRFKYSGQDVYTMYANLCQIDVKPGDIISRGQLIGSVGAKSPVRYDVENNLVFEVRVGENAPYYGRNPELWLETNTKNNGMIVGKLTKTGSGPIPQIAIMGADKQPEIKGSDFYDTSTSYCPDAIPDELYQENFAIRDVTSGEHKLNLKIEKTTYTKNVVVEHGKISVVTWDIP